MDVRHTLEAFRLAARDGIRLQVRTIQTRAADVDRGFYFEIQFPAGRKSRTGAWPSVGKRSRPREITEPVRPRATSRRARQVNFNAHSFQGHITNKFL